MQNRRALGQVCFGSAPLSFYTHLLERCIKLILGTTEHRLVRIPSRGLRLLVLGSLISSSLITYLFMYSCVTITMVGTLTLSCLRLLDKINQRGVRGHDIGMCEMRLNVAIELATYAFAIMVIGN